MLHEPETLKDPTVSFFTERPSNSRFGHHELRPPPGSRNYVIRKHDGERGWGMMTGCARR